MRIVKVLAAVVAVLGFTTSARGEDYVRVEKRAGSPAGTVVRDTIAGGLLGAAVSGGVIGYHMGINNESDYNWQRTLAIGSAIGLGVGLVWGIVDASTGSYARISPWQAHDGMSTSLDLRRVDQSGVQAFPLAMGHF